MLLSLEDEQSSRLYFAGLGKQHRERVSITFAKHIGSDPGNVVEAARRTAAEVAHDEVWCVFDTEGPQHPARRQQVPAALDRLRQLGYREALSNPCFEYWLLLHFQNSTRQYQNCSQLLSDLKNHLKGYEKGYDCFADVVDKIDEALARAAQNYTSRYLNVHGEVIDCNPITQVHLLVERIRA